MLVFESSRGEVGGRLTATPPMKLPELKEATMIPIEHKPRERRSRGCPRSVPTVAVHHGKAITEDVDTGEAPGIEIPRRESLSRKPSRNSIAT